MSCSKQCTMCCRAIWLRKDVADYVDKNSHPDAAFVRENWVRISEEEARDINPYYFNIFVKEANSDLTNSAFFTCSKVTENGCGVYEDRPQVCRGYPYTKDKPWREVAKSHAKLPPEYHPECTQWPTILVKNIL